VSHEHHLTYVARNRVDDPVGRIAWLKTTRRGERGEWIAAALVRFRSLPRTQFAAVPDRLRVGAARGRLLREHVNLGATAFRQRPHGVHVGAYRIPVVN
jgi:hypothetical protein